MSGVTTLASGGGGGGMMGAVELCETGGRALKLQTDTPHLVSLGGGRLSTAVTIHPIPIGRVTIGSGSNCDIGMAGTGVQAVHCHIENQGGIVTLLPMAEHTSVDGVRVSQPTRLTQGVMLTIGRSNYMRFNHPAEAKLMKSVLPNSRISMAPITFEPQESYPSKYNKKPPVAPRRSPRESFSDGFEESSCIMSKVSKFEFLAAQNALKNVSPKVFSANSVTVNTPAKDVLGKAPPNLQNYAKNLPQSAINYSDSINDKHHLIKNKTPDRQVFERKYVNVTVNDTKNCNNRVIIHENGCIPKNQNALHPYVNVSIDERHLELNNLNNKNHSGSSQSLKNIGVNNFGNRMASPSPSFNRNPSPFLRSVTPSPNSSQKMDQRTGSVGELSNPIRGVTGSIEDLTHRKNEAEVKRNQAYVERVREQEDEKLEQARLEEILNMCAEYEKQVQWEKNNKPTPNRIKTNGSLPRDKRQYSPSTEDTIFQFDSHQPKDPPSKPTWSSTPHTTPTHPAAPKNNLAQYENVIISQMQQVAVCSTPKHQEAVNQQGKAVCYENVELKFECGSPYENVVERGERGERGYPHSPRTKIKTCVSTSKQSTPKDFSDSHEPKFTFCPTNSHSPTHNYPEHEPSPSPDANHDISATPRRKLSPQKFILPMEDLVNSSTTETSTTNTTSTSSVSAGNVDTSCKGIAQEKIKYDRLEKLKGEKRDIMQVMVTIKRKIADIETQEEELLRDLELEKALLNGEHQSKQTELQEDEQLKEKLLNRAKQIEIKMEECRITQSQHQEDCKRKLEHAMNSVDRLESELSKISKTQSTYPDLIDELSFAREQLDNERKAFEDLEFHHLEEEADWLASREEIQREILDLSQKIEQKKSHILDLDTQKADTLDNTTQESRSLERQLLTCLRKIEDCRTRLALIDSELQAYSDRESENEISSDSENEKLNNKLDNFNLLKNQLQAGKIKVRSPKKFDESYNMTQSFHEKLQSPKKHDDVFNMSQSFNEKLLQEKSILDFDGVGTKCPSQDDIDRISKVTSNAPINMEDGRGSLGRKTIESLKEIERNRQLHLHQQGSQVIEHERKRVLALKQRAQDEVRTQWAQNRHKDCTSLNSTGSEETQLDSVSGSDETDKRNSAATTSGNEQNQQDVMKMRSDSSPTPSTPSPRPISSTSSLSCDLPSDIPTPRRPRPSDRHRPLTRYLPIRSSELDLRAHVETAGHQVGLCSHVTITKSTCKGFLNKMGSKLHGWSRRWFVFDRERRMMVYYADKNEKKVRGGAYFQAIEEVYIDHQNSVKSPNPHLTFIIKTHERSYHLMAPSPEAMRIWVDVVFTGAEGYQEFEHGT